MMKAYLEKDYHKAAKEGDYKWFLKHGFRLKITGGATFKRNEKLIFKINVDVTPSEKMLKLKIPRFLKEKEVRKMVEKVNRRKK